MLFLTHTYDWGLYDLYNLHLCMYPRGLPSYIVVYILFLGGIFSYDKGINFMVVHAPDLIPSSNIECTLREIGLHSKHMLTL